MTNHKQSSEELREAIAAKFDDMLTLVETQVGVSERENLTEFVAAQVASAREEERESGPDGEGLWMGRSVKDMSRVEIIKAWKHTDDLYRASLKEAHLTAKRKEA